ncbi:hormogonium polysaccharide secretion pseudopilin HpsC [Anabaena azotica]|uniref:Prepilin-type N-terminal cleavage/methylation domain-containing protein n=1 Tax=Anabaena azotica FACHB-119 TaxID=947527 RepID=A0ABR8D543_9NOST|nr:hormogonium polysaccharide secretion pseudopilin HpsC [Anabaena azotica]MBD2500873.1 prepilin-type N-terminal cleavage/methylation domain-containing protein [Anabaena azotica FACHB-119]
MNILTWLLTIQIKLYRHYRENRGFTLIELLVALLLAFLVIAPLMGLMISLLDSDRKEQAKANSEQEIQAAMDYINRDLQQAIYIYDATGVDAIKGQLPTITNGNPVLIFWKRELLRNSSPTSYTQSGTTVSFSDDAFVNSLVAYYLIRDNQTPWSRAARIARFQIQDGVPNKNGSTCSTAYDTTTKFSRCPHDGFQPVNLLQKDKTLAQKMNSWTKTSQAYTQQTTVLVDFIDHTQTTASSQSPPAASCPTSDFTVVPSGTTYTGFYACVDSLTVDNRSVVEVYLRGNALARLSDNANRISYNRQQLAFFPTARTRIEGRSFIFSK